MKKIPLPVGTIMYVGMWALRSFSGRALQGFSIHAIWLRGRVHISVNVLRRVDAKLAVRSAITFILPHVTATCLTKSGTFILLNVTANLC